MIYVKYDTITLCDFPRFCCASCKMSLTRVTFSMSFDGHQWNIPVESYFFMFSSIVSIWSWPGTNNGSCLKQTNQKNKENLSWPNSWSSSNNNEINDTLQTLYIRHLQVMNWMLGSRAAVTGRDWEQELRVSGTSDWPIRGVKVSASCQTAFPSVSRSCCYDFIFNH